MIWECYKSNISVFLQPQSIEESFVLTESSGLISADSEN